MTNLGSLLTKWQRQTLTCYRLLSSNVYIIAIDFLKLTKRLISRAKNFRFMQFMDATMLGRDVDNIDAVSKSLKGDDLNNVMQQINIELNAINSKSASLLQHISLMIAALTLIYGSEPATNTWLGKLIIANVILYIFALFFVLRVIWVIKILTPDVEERISIQVKELLILKNYLRFALRVALFLTPFLALMFIAAEFLTSSLQSVTKS